MKVSITRKDGGSREFECESWDVIDGAVCLYLFFTSRANRNAFYACTDWLEVEVVSEDNGCEE